MCSGRDFSFKLIHMIEVTEFVNKLSSLKTKFIKEYRDAYENKNSFDLDEFMYFVNEELGVCHECDGEKQYSDGSPCECTLEN